MIMARFARGTYDTQRIKTRLWLLLGVVSRLRRQRRLCILCTSSTEAKSLIHNLVGLSTAVIVCTTILVVLSVTLLGYHDLSDLSTAFLSRRNTANLTLNVAAVSSDIGSGVVPIASITTSESKKAVPFGHKSLLHRDIRRLSNRNRTEHRLSKRLDGDEREEL